MQHYAVRVVTGSLEPYTVVKPKQAALLGSAVRKISERGCTEAVK